MSICLPNATITAYQHRAGEKGDGTPLLQAVMIGVVIQCRLDAPSDALAQRAQSAGRQVHRVVSVPAMALRHLGVEPDIGDRVTVAFMHHQPVTYLVTMVTPDASGASAGTPCAHVLELATVNDGAVSQGGA